MGTRHLIMIVVDERPVVAQYGQWDGYPSGQGRQLENHLVRLGLAGQDTDPAQVHSFFEQCRKVRSLTQEEVKERWSNPPPAHLSRDQGADVIPYVMSADEPEAYLQPEFAADSLFCEWAYVLDLDRQRTPVRAGLDRFFQLAERHLVKPLHRIASPYRTTSIGDQSGRS